MADSIDWEKGEITPPAGAPATAQAESVDWEQGEIKPPLEPKGFGGHVRDLGVSLAKGAVSIPEAAVGLADIPTGGKVGKFLENKGGMLGFRPKETKEIMNDWHTDQYKEQQQQFQDAEGFGDKFQVAVENPSLIAGAVAESAPLMGGGGVVGRGVMAVAPKVPGMVAGAIGEGAMSAGTSAEQIRQQTEDGELTPAQSGYAAGAGAATTLFGAVGGRLAQKLGIGDVDTLLTTGLNNQNVRAVAKGIPRQIVEGAISEGLLEELPQSMSEQILQNLALDKSWDEQLSDAAVMGILSGGAMGGMVAPFHGQPAATPQPAPVPPAGGPAPGTPAPGTPAGSPAPGTPPAANPIPASTSPAQPQAQQGPAANPAPASASTSPTQNQMPPAPQPTPASQMGLDPNAGPLSAAATIAVDSGATDHLQEQAALQQAEEADAPLTVAAAAGEPDFSIPPPPESLYAQTAETEQASPQPAQAGSQAAGLAPVGQADQAVTPAAPTNLQEGLAKVREQKRQAGADVVQVNALPSRLGGGFSAAVRVKAGEQQVAWGKGNSKEAAIADARQKIAATLPKQSQEQSQEPVDTSIPNPGQSPKPNDTQATEPASAPAFGSQEYWQQKVDANQTQPLSDSPAAGVSGSTDTAPSAPAGAASQSVTPPASREDAITTASTAASTVLQQGGTEADANRAATTSLIDQMAVVPDIAIAEDAPKAVQQAQRVGEVSSENARRGEYDVRSIVVGRTNRAKVLETAQRGVFTVSVEGESYGSFKMDDQGTVSNLKARANWAQDAVNDAANAFAKEHGVKAAPAQPQPQAPAADIKTVLAKTIPEMTDAEMEQAIAHYGPDHPRTAKLKKKLAARKDIAEIDANMASRRAELSQPADAASVMGRVNAREQRVEQSIPARRPQPGEPDYKLEDAQADLDAMQRQAAEAGYVADDRLNDRIRRQQALISEMQTDTAQEQQMADDLEAADAFLADEMGESFRPAPTNLREGLAQLRQQKAEQAASTSTAPEHANVQSGVSEDELKKIVAEFNAAQESMQDGDDQIHHLFDDPAKEEVVRLADKAKVYHKEHGWMTPAEAKAKIAEWKAHAKAQGKRGENADKVVLSLFDLTGKWSQPWEDAGYQVWRFDIQDDPEMGDVNNFSTEFFSDWFGDFDGDDIYAILAATPCTDFAVSGARHFAAKDKDGRTVASVKLVHQTLAAIEYFKPAVWAIENPVGRIEKLGGLPAWRLSFDPNQLGDPYTKKTLLWGRFNADLPIAPVEPTEGSKMHSQYGGKSLATKNARSATPEGFAYGFFMANNAIDNPVMALANKFDRLDRSLIQQALDAGVSEEEITSAVEDYYYQDLDDEAANEAIQELIDEAAPPPQKGPNESAPAKAEVQAAPSPQPEQKADPFAGNKLFTTDAVAAARARMKSKLGQLNSGIDPELLMDGMTIAGAYIESGVRKFADYAQAMVDDLGEGVKPYLLSFWEGARAYPGLDTTGMTSAEESAKEHAALLTPAVIERAEAAIGEVAEKPKTKTRKTGAKGDMVLTQDWGVEHIDGYGTSDDRETGNDTKDAFLKEARAYLSAVGTALASHGFTTHTDGKGRPEKAVSVSEGGAAVSGDVSLTMRNPDTGENVYVTIGGSSLRGAVPTTQSGIAIMWRKDVTDDRYATRATNRWAKPDMSANELATGIAASSQKLTEQAHADKLVELAKQPHGRYLGELADHLQGMGWTPHVRRALLYRIKGIPDSDNQLSLLIRNANNNTNVRVTMGGNVGLSYTLSTVSGDVLAHQGLPTVEVSEGTPVDELAGQINEQASKVVPAAPAEVKSVRFNRTSRLTQHWGVALDEWGTVKDRFMQEARTYLHSLGKILQERGYQTHRDTNNRVIGPVDAILGSPENHGSVYLMLRHRPSEQNLYVDIGMQVFQDKAPRTDDLIGVSVHFGKTKDQDTHVLKAKEAVKSWAPVDLDATQLADLITAKMGVATEQGDSNERTAVRGDGQEALDNVASEEGGRPESGRGIGAGRADSGQAGIRAGGGADAAGVSAARSGRGGSERVRDAETGNRGQHGRVGTVGGSDVGSALPANEVRVTASGAPAGAPNIPASNFQISDDTRLGQGGEVQKFNDNLAAIRTLKKIEAEHRRATPEEQAVLARYVGWGGLANAFPDPTSGQFKDKWEARGNELRELLTDDEYKAARRSTRNAHYTAETVASAMWKAVERLGFKGGLVLESSMGVGNFLGLAPRHLPTRFIGVEYDSLTARLAGALYPQATVLHAGFQQVPVADDAFALNIGNPPFGSESLRFQYKPELQGVSIHNQFFRAGMDALRPGGIQAMVVSRFLMDAKDKASRLALARQAKLVGLIRLPDTAFKENARTEVVTDIVILQKLTADEQTAMDEAVNAYLTPVQKNQGKEMERQALAAKVPVWVETTEIPDPLGGEAMTVNAHFRANPEDILGTLERSGSMQHGADITVRLDNAAELSGLLDKAIQRLPQNIQDVGAEVLATTESRFKSMSDALRIALARQEPGHVSLESDGKLYRVIERETPEGGFEYLRQEITEDSPWSEQLSMDASGHWYRLAVKTDEAGNVVKFIKDGKATTRNVYERTTYANDQEIPASLRLGKAGFERLKAMAKLRDLLKRQLVLETADAAKAVMEGNRKSLAAAYAEFADKHGPLNRPVNLRLAMTMPDGGLLTALEVAYQPARSAAQAEKSGLAQQAESATPAPILRERVVPKYEPVSRADTPADALAVNLAESGRVDMDRIAQLLGTDAETAAARLQEGDNPLVFLDPESQQWETANAYLSGMVKRKLEAARAAGLTGNVAALEKVIPEDWGAENVTVQLGSTWVPAQTYADFVEHLTGAPATVHFSALTNAFAVNAQAANRRDGQWATEDASTDYIVGRLLNSQSVTITRTDINGNTYVDKEATALANLKAREIANEFGDWVFKDADRRAQLVAIFNERYNTRVVRQYDGQHLKLPGKVPDSIIKLRRHQMNAVWRGIYERFMLMDHAVGAGKTFTAIARAMERRRMGLSRKPMVAVPNHLVEQWAADVYRLYPGAKVLAAGKKDFEAKRRRRLFGKIATGDWDIVIVPHSSFGFIGIAPETESRYLEQEMREAMAAIEDAWEQAREDGNDTGRRKPFGVKEAERLAEKIQGRMEAIAAGARDRLLTFEQLGVDDLTIDEAHEFKNLNYSSRLTGVRGMGDKTGSRKANDLYNKVRVLRDSPNGTVTFLTGTPISNSAVEMFTILRYLAADSLDEMGMTHFDAFRAQFVEATPAFEPTESGRLKEVTRLGRTWSNMRALMDLYYQVTDAVSLDDIKRQYAADNKGAPFPVPKVKGGKDRQLVTIQPTPAQVDALKDIMDGFDSLESIEDPYERNAERLRLMDRARKVSLDVRAVSRLTNSTEQGGKLQVVSENIKRIYDATTEDLGTQLVFLDRSVPKSKGDEKILKEYDALVAKRDDALRGNDMDGFQDAADALEKFDANEIAELREAQTNPWNGYLQIKQNLVAMGVPANEIRFVQEANNDEQKAALFDAVNGGKVRVLIGSTPRMGAGTNVQQRAVALHHVDVTWKPSDIEQREGRVIRQGNKLLEKYGPDFEVEILAYATERTVDAKMWDLNATKLRTINGIRKYDGAFSMEFEDEEAVGMAEMAALASGNPLLLERVKLESDIGNLELQERGHRRKMYGIQDALATARRRIERNPALIEVARERTAEARRRVAELGKRAAQRTVTVEGQQYDNLRDALQATEDAIQLQQDGNEKARYAITIDGQRVTTKDGITEAIGAALGDNHPFEATVAGKTTYQRTAAARQIAELLNGVDTAEEGTTVLPLGEMFGYQLEADIDVSTVRVKAKSGETTSARVKNVRFTLLDNGKTVTTADTAEFGAAAPLLTQNIRPAVDRLMEAVNRAANSDEAGYLTEQLERAQREVSELESLAGGAFPKAAELAGKRERLTEVVRELEGNNTTPVVDPASDEQPPQQEARFSFAGVYARVADRHALATAQGRLQRGDNPEQVRQDTGWHQGVDGKWRFEITDDQAKLAVTGSTAGAIIDMGHINALLQDRTEPTVGDVLDHPQLYAAYPALARVEIATTPAGVTASARLRRTAMGMKVEVKASLPRADMASAVLHELQHAIQYREGFAAGGSSKALGSDLDPSGMATYRRLAGEVEARNTQARQGMTADERRTTSPQMTADTPDSEVLVTFNGRDMVSELANVPASSPATQRAIKAVRNTVESVRKAWRNSPPVTVVWDISDAQVPEAIRRAHQQAQARGEVGTPEGVWHKGRVYLFARELATPGAVVRTLLHETYGHHGLRGVFGADLVAVLDQIIAARPTDIQDKLAEYALDDTLNGRRQAAEELLAVMAQDNPKLGWVRNAIAAIRTFLRGLGLNVFQLSNDEIIRNFLMPARRFVAEGRATTDRGEGLNHHNEAYDAGSPFSRASVSQMASKVAGEVHKALSAPGKLSWWHKTVGTMYNLGQRNPYFKAVYRVAQGYLDDVSHYAIDAAERAPTLLPRLDTWADIFKSSISVADNKAVAAPVFEGTLVWMRDSNGHPVKVEDVAASYAGMSADDKAQLLIQAGKLSVGMYNAWAQHPNFADMVETRFKATMLKPGVVWRDTELRTLFNLTDAQIALYREFRSSADRSLDTLTRSDMLRFAGDDLKHMQAQVMAAPSARNAVRLMMVELTNISQQQPNRAGQMGQLAHGLRERLQKLEGLQAEGYAPLSRFGKYTVTVKDAAGEVEYFGLYESAYDANTAAGELAQAYPNSGVTQGTLSDEKYKLYAGITPETLELFGQALSFNATGDSAEDLAFQELLRLTKNNRSAMKRLIHRKGIAGYSEDVGRVLASFTYSNARHTAAGLHMGDLKKAVEAIPQQQGELTDAAQQLAEYVQNPQEEAQAIRGMLFAQYLGGSIAAAMVNMTQPLAVTFPWLSQYGGAKQAAAQLTKAAKQMATRGYRYEPLLATALKQAEDDGIVSPQEIHQLMAQARGRGAMRAGDGTRAGNARATAANAVARLMVAWGKPFGAAEQVNRRMTFIAAFRIAIERGNPPKRAAAFARKAVTETQFTYSKAAKMKWGRGAVGGTLMTFKTYSIAYLELGHRLWNQGQPGSVERKAGRKAVMLMMATLLLLGGAGGLPFAEDAEDLLDGLAQLAGYNFSAAQARETFLTDLLGQDAARLLNKGLTGLPGMPVDVAGRLGMGNLIPGTGLLKTSRDHTRDVLEIVGPVGDFAKRLATGAGKAVSGDILGGALEVSPTAVRNLAKGADMAATGMYRDQKGYKIIDTDLGEAVSKGIGFQPNDVARVQEANRFAQSSKAFYNLRAQEVRALWAAGLFEGDQEKVRQARAQVADWNAKNPEQRMVIRMPDVMRRVREMRKSKDQRIADTAPKSMRQQLRADAASLHQELDE